MLFPSPRAKESKKKKKTLRDFARGGSREKGREIRDARCEEVQQEAASKTPSSVVDANAAATAAVLSLKNSEKTESNYKS